MSAIKASKDDNKVESLGVLNLSWVSVTLKVLASKKPIDIFLLEPDPVKSKMLSKVTPLRIIVLAASVPVTEAPVTLSEEAVIAPVIVALVAVNAPAWVTRNGAEAGVA